MKKLVVSLALLASLSYAGKNVVPAPSEPIPVPVTAPIGLYLGAGLTYAHGKCRCDTSVKCSDGSSCATPHKSDTEGFNLKLGYDFNEYIGIEAKYLYTPWGDTDKTMKHYGIYLKPSYPVSEKFDLYALLGYGKTECETLLKSEKGFAWGIGAAYSFGKRIEGKKKGWGVYLEYLRPLHKTGSKKITVDTVSAGLQYNF